MLPLFQIITTIPFNLNNRVVSLVVKLKWYLKAGVNKLTIVDYV